MRRVLLAVNLMCVGLAAGGVGFTEITSAMVVQRVRALQAVCERYTALQIVQLGMRRIELLQRFPELAPSARDRGREFGQLAGVLEAFVPLLEKAHEASTVAVNDVGSAAKALQNERRISIVLPRVGADDLVLLYTTAGAGQAMASNARRIVSAVVGAATVADLPRLESTTVTFIEYASWTRNVGAVSDAFNQARLAMLEDLDTASALVGTLQLVLMLTGFAAIVASAASFFTVEMRKIYSRMMLIHRVLLLIPARVLVHIKEQSTMQQEISLVEMDAEEGLDEEEEGAAATRAAQAPAVQEVQSIEDLDPNTWRTMVYGHRSRQRLRGNQQNPAEEQRMPTRPYRDSSHFVSRTTLRITLPLVVVGAWIAGMYAHHSSENRASTDDVRRASVLSRAVGAILGALDGVETACVQSGPTSTLDERFRGSVASAGRAEEFGSVLWFGGVISDEATGLGAQFDLPAFPRDRVYSAMAGIDLCVAMGSWAPLPKPAWAEPSDTHSAATCRAVEGGLVRGMGTLLGLAHTSAFLRAAVHSANLSAPREHVCETLLDATSLTKRLIIPYYSHAVDETTRAIFAGVAARKASLRTSTVISCVLFAVGFTLYTIFYYLPKVDALSSRISSARSLLLLVPNRVYSIPFVRAALKDVIRDDGKAAKSGAVVERSPRRDSRRDVA